MIRGVMGAVATRIAARLPVLEGEAPLHEVTTEDGWRLRVAEYGAGNDGPVVYLQHGLAASHLAFDLHPHGFSPARWLAEQGYRVYAGDLRGRLSGKPPEGTDGGEWSLSDYLLRDLPALVAFVHARTGERMHWVGHSMGGILGLAYAGHFGGSELASITTLGSALHYGVGGTVFEHVNRLRPLLTRISRIPYRSMQRFAAPLLAAGLPPSPANVTVRNMTPASLAAIAANVFIDMTRAELMELGSTFEEAGIRIRELDRLAVELAAELPVPWLSVVGAADKQCTPDCAMWTFSRIAAPEKRLYLAGTPNGCRHDYGHFDLVCGNDAQTEIWHHVRSFIDEMNERLPF